MVTRNKKIKVPAVKAVNLFILLFLLFGIIIWGIIILFYKVQLQSIEKTITKQEVHATKLLEAEIENSLSDIVSDLLFISTQNELQDFLTTGDPDSIEAMKQEYTQLSLRKKKYDQIRYLDNKGREIVRVNYNSGQPAPVVKEDLQNKQKRYYFNDTFKLGAGEIFISPMDLNIEHGKIEQPFKPMLRLGTPVFNSNGDKVGIVLINYLAENLLAILKKNSSISYGHSVLLNHQGYWLFHGDPAKEWGFMFNDKQELSFSNSYPQEWEIMLKQKTGQLHTDKGLFTFSTVYPLLKDFQEGVQLNPDHQNPNNKKLDSPHLFWILVSHVSPKLLKEQTAPLQFRVFSLGLGLFILVSLAAWVLAFAITKRRIHQEHLLSMTLHDALTLLPNRKLFFERLEVGLSHADRYKKKLGVLYLDLDGFKAVNDTFGHEHGNDLLVRISKRMLAITRKADTVARLGGVNLLLFCFR